MQILDAFAVSTKDSYEELYIVCELMDFDLHKLISSATPLGLDHIKLFVYQLLLGLKCMHSAQVLHRDLKPKNILVNRDSGELKICDLGMGRTGSSESGRSQLRMTVLTEVATPCYRAPDGILNLAERPRPLRKSANNNSSSNSQQSSSAARQAGQSASMDVMEASSDPSPSSSDSSAASAACYTSAVDMWAAGCILAELVLRKPIFPGKTNKDLLELIIKLLGSPAADVVSRIPEGGYRRMLETSIGTLPRKLGDVFPPSTDKDLIDLVGKLLRFDPDERISVDEALNHPFLDELHDIEEEDSMVAPHFSFPEDEGKDLRDLKTYRELLWQELSSFSSLVGDKPQS